MSAPAKATTAQPQAAEMSVMTPPTTGKANGTCQHTGECEHQHKHKMSRMRGAGAGKDCFLGMLGCFLCFECCEGCCECIADIVCCPCEMCC
ncbi:hypothetical protein MIND_00816600 [Mycena indigotica]|uniref:Cysteine-rich transmembrane CYSTM domain-containing protein n=1 Tax=Mycena indigotica TaxID=2126181 RepID=A0A8H6SFQ2_9AGAR|nr:uncharacterized protein MIND_00816600 [Mycena indigotica]KAF7298693.1 hypothetical protein MIND_00816600 [Mycena indigotica]